jgi:hypothetical protein
MLLKEKTAVCSQNHKKHINTQRGQNAELFYVKPGGTCNYLYAVDNIVWLS